MFGRMRRAGLKGHRRCGERIHPGRLYRRKQRVVGGCDSRTFLRKSRLFGCGDRHIARAIALVGVLKAIRTSGRESSARLELNRVAEPGFIQCRLIPIGFRTRAKRESQVTVNVHGCPEARLHVAPPSLDGERTMEPANIGAAIASARKRRRASLQHLDHEVPQRNRVGRGAHRYQRE